MRSGFFSRLPKGEGRKDSIYLKSRYFGGYAFGEPGCIHADELTASINKNAKEQQMNTRNKRMIRGMIFAGLMIALIGLFSIDTATSETYKVRPEVTVGIEPYKSDVVRIVDAYEKLMDRYISIVDQDMNRAVGTLERLETKMDMIDARLERIERAMGIPQPGDIIDKEYRGD